MRHFVLLETVEFELSTSKPMLRIVVSSKNLSYELGVCIGSGNSELSFFMRESHRNDNKHGLIRDGNELELLHGSLGGDGN